MTNEALILVTEIVLYRAGRIRWVVIATFVGADGSEPRCVDYRVRVVPSTENGQEMLTLGRLYLELQRNAISAVDASALGAIPPEGIPRYVFERASQSRLLAKAKKKVARSPSKYPGSTRRALDRTTMSRQGRAKTGRPPTRSLGEKLKILKDVADAYSADVPRARATVAQRHFMSEGQLRDLLKWARHSSNPPLFTNYGPGLRNDTLTPEAVQLLTDGTDD